MKVKRAANKTGHAFDVFFLCCHYHLQYLQGLFVVCVVGLSAGSCRCHGLMLWCNLDGYTVKPG